MNKKIGLAIFFLMLFILPFISAQDCYDNDGGLNYGISGEASRFNATNLYVDRCADSTTLLEAVCGDDGWAAHATYDCSSEGKFCQDGACINPCTDSDGGKNLIEAGTASFGKNGQGDWCDYSMSENKIQEAYCINDTSFALELMDCPQDKPYCNKGKCTSEKPQCTENDSGKNPLVLGTTFPSRIEGHTGNTDYCQITSTGQPPENQNQECSGSDCSLREFYCPGGPDESFEDIPCPSGCSNGVCTKIEPTQETGPIEIIESEAAQQGATTEVVKELVCNGCVKNNSCYPIGYRTENQYCDNKQFSSQKQADSSCNNNFECSTNLCIDNQCVSSGFWQAIIRFFKNLFE